LRQLIQITANSSTAAQATFISPTPTAVWPQVIAYASLALSLIAAFGAVLAKQWLGHYKINRYDRGSLGNQCKQRHRKFRELMDKGFEDALQSFTVLLQISLFLFALSIAGAMWTQQRTVSILIVVMAGRGALFLCYVIVVSSASPDSSFQTSISLFIQRMRDARRCLEDDVHLTVSAMTWILDTSTNPDVLRSVLDLMITPSHNVLSTQLVEKVLNMFKTCFAGSATDKDSAQAYGRAFLDLPHHHPAQKDRLQTITLA
jgi:hypothetical protein